MTRNIVLIGLSGCGKSTLAPIIAEKLGFSLVDTDAEIVKKAGMSISRIFSEKGETTFREMETAEAYRCAALSGTVISTGGGMVLKEENMRALSETGLVVFLDRSPEDIIGGDLSDRPLLAADRQKIFRLYDERIDLYRKYSELTVQNSGDITTVADTLIAKIAEALS